MTLTAPPPGMSRAMTFLFALTGGAAVGNLYWAQPLLAEMSSSLGVPITSTGLLITATQLGYASGVLLLVPLGDTLNRRRLIPVMMTICAIALVVSSTAPNYFVLLASLAAVGATTVSAQLLVPLASDLARDDQRGKVVGSIASGMLIGILLSRTVSGLVAAAFGWRAIYLIAAVVTIILAISVSLRLPADRPRQAISYGRLLASIGGTVSAHPAIGVTLFIAFCTFGVFTMFWTGLTFLLSSPAFSYSVTQIGLVGLVGLAGAIAARQAGKLHDGGWSSWGTGAALGLALLSLGLAAAGATSIFVLLAAVFLIDIAVQTIAILNQTRLFSIAPDARSRVNTAFVVSNFTGGALGSIMAGVFYEHGGWYALAGGQAAIIAIALLVWVLGRGTLALADHGNHRSKH